MGGLGSIPGLGSAPPMGTGMSEFGSASDLTLTVTPGHRSYMTRGGLGLGPDDSGVMSNEFGDQNRLGSALSDSAPLTMARGQGQRGGEPRVLNPADGMSDDDALIGEFDETDFLGGDLKNEEDKSEESGLSAELQDALKKLTPDEVEKRRRALGRTYR